MQPQFTDKAKTALILAERAARSLRQSYVGSEHILLGLLRENTGVAATVLLNNGVDVVRLKEMIKDLIVPETSVLIAERDVSGLPKGNSRSPLSNTFVSSRSLS